MVSASCMGVSPWVLGAGVVGRQLVCAVHAGSRSRAAQQSACKHRISQHTAQPESQRGPSDRTLDLGGQRGSGGIWVLLISQVWKQVRVMRVGPSQQEPVPHVPAHGSAPSCSLSHVNCLASSRWPWSHCAGRCKVHGRGVVP